MKGKTMTDQKIRWGIISTAGIGRRAVIPAIRASRNGLLAGIASRDAARAAQFATENGFARSFGSYEALLDDPAIDAVYNPLPNSLHHEWTIKAIQAGKHVLCEKPLAMNAAQCAEMIAAAKQHGVLLMEAFMYRFHPRSQQVFGMVHTGKLGDVRLIQAGFTFRVTNPANIRLSYELGGGALMDVGCYCVNVSRTLANAEPEAVQATARWASSGVDEQLVGSLRFPGGLIAQIDCSLSMERRMSYQVAGSDGWIAVPQAFLPGKAPTVFTHTSAAGEILHESPGVDQYQLMVEHFADCILNREPLLYPPAEGMANMRVIEALYRSARNQGSWEELI
jgi:predicted dehydrogenase